MNKSSRKVKLDIACGKNKKPGFCGVDIWEGADVVCNLEQFPWPFATSSVDEVFCSHYIEHTPDLVLFANELYRIMKVGAKAEIIAPYYSSIRAWQDPTHLRAISENTFLYFNREWREMNKLDHYPIKSDFDFSYRFIVDEAWRGKSDEELRFATRHYINVVSDIQVILVKKPEVDEMTALQLQKATEYWGEGRFEEALHFCNELINSGNANSDIYLMVAENATHDADYEKAIESFARAIEMESDSLQAHIGIVRIYHRLGRISDAELHLKHIEEQHPGLAETIELILDNQVEGM